MEFSFLYAIPRTAFLDSFFLAVTKVAGSYGELWVIIAAALLLFRKTRKAGAAMILAGLSAEGETTVTQAWHLDRGYGDFVPRLQSLGAEVHSA